jgi:hypothetical protein
MPRISALPAGAPLVATDEFHVNRGDTSSVSVTAADVATYASSNAAVDATTVTTTPYTVLSTDHTLIVDDAIGIMTIDLLAAASESGQRLQIKKIGNTANVIIDANGSETIDRGLTATLTTQYENLTIVSDGTEWWIL